MYISTKRRALFADGFTQKADRSGFLWLFDAGLHRPCSCWVVSGRKYPGSSPKQ